jgi:hypothetical protein
MLFDFPPQLTCAIRRLLFLQRHQNMMAKLSNFSRAVKH